MMESNSELIVERYDPEDNREIKQVRSATAFKKVTLRNFTWIVWNDIPATL